MDQSYISVVDSVKGNVVRLLDGTEGWNVIKTHGKEKELIIESKPSEDLDCNIYRTTSIIDAPSQVVEQTFPLNPMTSHKEWAPSVNDICLLESFDDNIVVYQTITNSVAKVVSPRSFVTVAKAEKDDNSYLGYGISVDYHKALKEDGMIRGYNGPFGIRVDVNPRNPSQTRAVVIIHLDLKGKVPKKLLETIMPSSIVNSHECYRKYLKKHGLLSVE